MPDPDDPALRVPIFEGSMAVDEAGVQTGMVRIRTSVEEREAMVGEALGQGAPKIPRDAAGRPVDAPPPPREGGAITTAPLVENRSVVGKRLLAVEEIHVTREQAQERVAIPLTLRTTHAIIERPPGESETGSITNG